MTKEELFNESRAELDVKIAQHKMGVRFTAHQMQTIRVAMANMNFAASDLGGEYRDIAKNYNDNVNGIEIANQHNSDRGAYIKGDISPRRPRTNQKMDSALVSGISKQKKPQVTPNMALRAYQQYIQQQRQHHQNMTALTAGFANVAISQPDNDNKGIGSKYY